MAMIAVLCRVVVCSGALLALFAFNAYGLELRLPPRSPGAPFSFAFDTVPGSYYDVQTSSNLVSWSVLHTLRADTPSALWLDTNAASPARFVRVADWSGLIVVEGDIRTLDGQGVPDSCPFCDILVTSSLEPSVAYTDTNGHYVLRTRAAASSTNVPFTLFFSKLGFRAYSATVTDPSIPRLDVMSLAGPSNNDFTNRHVISGSSTNHGDNTQADIEEFETGSEPSVWYSFTAPANGTFRFAIDTTDFRPVIDVFSGQSLAELQPLARGVVSNWVEWRIEITRDLTVYAGEQLQIRVGALEHPTRGISGGSFAWKATFEPDFPLALESWNTNQGAIIVDPPPNAAGRYAPGTVVTLTGVPARNYIFTDWRGSVTSAQPSVTITMDEAKSIGGNFQLANGNYTNAIPLDGEVASAEAWVPLDGSVWYEWTAPRDMPVAFGYETTNFLHGTVYRVDAGALRYVANNHWYPAHPDHMDTRFWAVAGTTYKLAVNFEANEMGWFRFRLYEPIVFRAAVTGGYRKTVSISASFTNLSFTYMGGFGYEVWTRVQNDPALFPYSVSIANSGYRTTGGIIYSNLQFPQFLLTLTGPPNNDFSNATHIATSEGSLSGSYLTADREPGEPGLGAASVWYAFDPPTNGTYFITNNIRNTIEISGWEGEAVASLQAVRGRFHQQSSTTATTEWTARAGRTLYIRAATSGGQPGFLSLQYTFVPDFPLYVGTDQPLAGTVIVSPPSATGRYPADTVLSIHAGPEPHYLFGDWTGDISSVESQQTVVMNGLVTMKASFRIANDSFAAAQVLSGLPVTVSGANRYATAEPGEPMQGPWPAASSVWYRWTAPETGDMVIEFDFNDVTIVSTVFEGDEFAKLVPVANNLAGGNIRRVAFTAAANNTYHISVDGYGGDGGPFAFTIKPVFEARYVLRVPPLAGGYVEQTPAPDGNAAFGSGTDVTLLARPLNASTFVGWEELTWGEPVALGAGETVSIRMDRHRIVRPIFELGDQRWNDNFTDRQMLLANGTTIRASNHMATAEPGEPVHAPAASGRSLWWSWTSPTTAPIAFTTFGSSFSNIVAVYRGAVLGELERVAGGAPGLESVATFGADAGVTYHVAVDGIAGGSGAIRLRAVENEQFFAELVSPVPEQSWAEPALITVRAQAMNSTFRVSELTLLTNGFAAFSTTNAFLDTIITNPAPGPLVLVVAATDDRGRVVQSPSVTNYIHGYRFSTNSFYGFKSNGVVQISILRAQPSNHRTEVFLDMKPGTAVPGIHYTPLKGGVLFLPGESVRSVFIPLPPSSAMSEDPIFYARLSSGEGLPVIDSAAITISNDSFVQPATWFDDAFPPGAASSGSFAWISAEPVPVSGGLARRASGDHGYTGAAASSAPVYDTRKAMWQDVYVMPDDPPRLIGIRHPYIYGYSTVYWGDRSLLNWWDTWLGPLPESGAWQRIAVPKGFFQSGNATSLFWVVAGGTAVWDRTGTWP